ncbi:MAG: AraC family transcriptional regulator [Prevotella sp.]|jgi:AraC-like DNA-binding protein|nr:AraC family transcriptional regulator [Prevotella sp.]
MKEQIPTHKIQEKITTGIFLKRYQDGKATQNGNPTPVIEYAHRDNHYLFYLQEKGENCYLIDFKEYKITGTGLVCVLPGQVHLGVTMDNVSGWLLGIDSLFVKDEWKELLEMAPVAGNTLVPDTETLNDLKFGFSLLNRKIQSADHLLAQDAATLLIGMIAQLYRQRLPVASNKRQATIVIQFKSLLARHLKTVKSPAQYASMLHLSPSYLNEAVKNITGFPVSYWIQYAVTLEAKRLLFYTEKSISEVAFELGYNDNAYFTRLFAKASGVSPTQFRANYRK